MHARLDAAAEKSPRPLITSHHEEPPSSLAKSTMMAVGDATPRSRVMGETKGRDRWPGRSGVRLERCGGCISSAAVG
jgi:hypothetical protein